MSNVASSNLFDLIKSLSKAEKRYFKVYSSRTTSNDGNNYQRLFDAIDKQSEYNEDDLIKKFRKDSFAKRFSIAKSRLYQSILKSLDSFHASSSLDTQIKKQIHCAEILYNKSLYKQAKKLLISTKKVALKYEKTTSIIEINKWEKLIIEKDNYESIDNNDLEEILAEDQSMMEQINSFHKLWNVKSRIFSTLFQKGKARSQEEIVKFKKIIDDLTVDLNKKGLNAENTYLLNHLQSAYYYGVGDYESSYPFLKNNLKLIQDKPDLFKEEPNVFFSVLTNAIYVATQLGKFKEAQKLLKDMHKFSDAMNLKANSDIDMRLFSIGMGLELTLCIQSGSFEEGMHLVPQIDEGLLKYEEKLSSVRKAFFYFNIAVLYYGNGHLNESLKWLNQLLNNIEIDKTQDIHCMAQLMNLVVHLDLGNKSLLPYAIRSTQRYLETRHRVYGFEEIILAFVNEELKKRSGTTPEMRYKKLVKDISKLKKDDYEKNVFDYFDWLAWAKTKTNGNSYKDNLEISV